MNLEKRYREIDVEAEVSNVLEKRIKTAFIYCLCELEECMGELWANEMEDESKVTKEQQKVYDKFMVWRKSIMDYGNLQIRIGKKEVKKIFMTLTEKPENEQ